MPFTFVNSIISWFLKKRIHQVELFLKYPVEVQQELLNDLLQKAKNTEIGKKYGFASINDYETFKSNVPLRQYESIEPFVDKCRKGEQNVFWPTPIKWFAKSSGTTNAKSKFIPVSDEAIDDCHMKAGKDMLCMFFNNNPEVDLFSGKGLKLGGSSAVHESNKTYFGDLSAIIIQNMPFWADFRSSPSQKVSLMEEWEAKMEAILEESINEDITSFSGVPSWLLVLLNRVLEKTGKNNLLEVWPNLQVYFHGGVSFNPYAEEFSRLIPNKDFKYYQTYNASEGFFGVQDSNGADDMLLMLDYGIFYEFIPMSEFNGEDSNAIPLQDVELNINYALVITTNAGLWRYLIGDTVKFTSVSPYKIKVTGRTKHFINVFGEELIVENTDEALKRISKQTKATVKDYTVAPIFMKGEESGGHEWLIEFYQKPEDLEFFVNSLDETLKSINSDYEAKRHKNMTLAMPKINVAREGLFYDWLKKNNKLGGQHKVPRLSNSRSYLEDMLEMNETVISR